MGGSNESKWFDSMVVRKVEKGDKVLFWCNRWVGQQSLANEFPRLYLNSLQKEECIINMGEWAEGVWRWNFRWHRDWFVWEREVVERLSLMLSEATLVEGGEDSWIWKQDRTRNYLVKSSYLAL